MYPVFHACHRRYGVSLITFANIPCPLRVRKTSKTFSNIYDTTCSNAFLPSTAPGMLVFSDSQPNTERLTTGARFQGANTDRWANYTDMYSKYSARLNYQDGAYLKMVEVSTTLRAFNVLA